MELNYGKSYLSESEQARVNRKFCTGIHKNCILYLTDGILQNPVIKNNQYRFSQLQFEKNKAYYGNNHWIIKRNISVLAESLKRAFIIRKDENEEELSVEKRIYGKDFAYIRNISNFSRMIGTFLRRQIDM